MAKAKVKKNQAKNIAKKAEQTKTSNTKQKPTKKKK